MFLDSGDEVYVWIGAKADEEERSEGLEMAKKYLDADPTYRFVTMTFRTLFSFSRGDPSSCCYT